MVTCSICFEATREVGEIDSCYHRFCWSCINQWADRESRCPLCKQRFTCIKRKAIYTGDPHAPPSAKRQKVGDGLHTTDAAAASAPQLCQQTSCGHSKLTCVEHAADTAAGTAASAASVDDDVEPSTPKGELSGVVLEERRVHQRDQVYMPEDQEEDLQELVETLYCVVCGADDNDEFLLICDGCDQGYHTYCVNRRTIPLGDWFCPTCARERQARRQQRQAQRARERAEEQQRSEQQAATQATDAAAAAAAPAARRARRRLRRQASSAAAAADRDVGDSVDLTLFDSEAESEREGTTGVRRSRRTVTRRMSDDSDYEVEVHDEELHDDSCDMEVSDWELEQMQGPRRSSRGQGRRSAAAAAAAAALSVRNGTGRGGAREVEGTSSHGSTASDRLKSWHELREEEERTAATTTASNAPPAAAAVSQHNQGAAAAASGAGPSSVENISTSRRIVDLLQSINAERRNRQNQVASGAARLAGRGVSRHMRAEDEAWTALSQLRAAQAGAAAAGASRGGSSKRGRRAPPAASSASNTPRSATVVELEDSRNRTVASAYFRQAGQGLSHQQQRQSNHSAAVDAEQQQQQEDRLRQALLARLQKQEQQQRSVRSAADLADPRDPGYLDVMRVDITAARNKGEEDRRKRTSADKAAAAAAAAAAAVPRTGSRPASRGVAAAVQPVSRLARSISAAQQREAREQQQQRRREGSSNFMARWLDTGVSSHDERRAAASTGHRRQQQELPRAVRTLGAVRRGAAMQAAAAAAATSGTRLPGAAASIAFSRGGQHAGRQPLQLLPSQQQADGALGPNAAKESGVSRSNSRFFATRETAARAQAGQQQQQASWQHRLAVSHVMANTSTTQQRHQQQPAVSWVPEECLKRQRAGDPAAYPHHQHRDRQQQQQQFAGPSLLCRSSHGNHSKLQDVGGPGSYRHQDQLHVQALHSSNSSLTAAPGSATDAQCSTGTWAPQALTVSTQQLQQQQQQQQQQAWLAVNKGWLQEQTTEWLPQVQAAEQQQHIHDKAQQGHGQLAVHPHSEVSRQQSSAVAPSSLGYDDLKVAKLAAHSLAKGRLAPLFSGGKITRELYSHALKAATHELYERVKQGTVALQALRAAAEAGGGTAGAANYGAKGVGEVVVVLDDVLEGAGVYLR